MLRIAAALAVCAFSVAACSGGDGSSTGGTGAPGSAGGAGGSAAGVLEVVVVYRPVCGPEPRPPANADPTGTADPAAPPCPEQPLLGVEVSATRADGTLAASDTTSAAGRVSLPLDPGTYTLTAAALAPPRITPRPTTVTVGTEPVPTVTLVYESSMQ
jgi:hypothetical protein